MLTQLQGASVTYRITTGPQQGLAGIGYFRFVWLLAALSRRNLSTVLAVGRKDSVEAGEIDAWFRHQSCQLGNEIHGF
mgnify:CR=1 FL=1